MSDNDDEIGSSNAFSSLSSATSAAFDSDLIVDAIEQLCDHIEALAKVTPFDHASRELQYNEMSRLLAEMQSLCNS